MLVEQEATEGHLGAKAEKMLGQAAVLQRPFRIRTFHPSQLVSVPPDELQWPRESLAQRMQACSGAEDASVQTSAVEGGNAPDPDHEGPRGGLGGATSRHVFQCWTSAGGALQDAGRLKATAPAFPRRTESKLPPAPYLVISCLQSKHLKITSIHTTFKYLSSLVSPLPVLILTST